MKTNILSKLLVLIFSGLLISSCTQEGAVGPQGEPGKIDVYYSQWYTPNSWDGQAGDWYFDVTSPDINQDVVEGGIILAYMSVPNDIYQNAVRPMPAWAVQANWDFLIPDYGTIEFTCDSEIAPGTTDHYFRFVIIPSGTQLKSTKAVAGHSKEELMKMPYQDVCKLFGIPE
jgi:hypothetical protein